MLISTRYFKASAKFYRFTLITIECEPRGERRLRLPSPSVATCGNRASSINWRMCSRTWHSLPSVGEIGTKPRTPSKRRAGRGETLEACLGRTGDSMLRRIAQLSTGAAADSPHLTARHRRVFCGIFAHPADAPSFTRASHVRIAGVADTPPIIRVRW